jgi:ubiquinone/menaquinone biosynthesis C-methylase UbiE
MTTHQEQNAAIRDQFSKQAAGYAELVRDGKLTTLERLVEVVKPKAVDQALDVGCGTGRLSISLAAHVGQVIGIDLTPEMLDQARALQAETKVTNIRWQQGDILPLPFADSTFSIVVTQATFHHFADSAAVLAQMARVCTPAGRIAVIDMLFDPAKVDAFDRMERMRDPSHHGVLTVDHLRAMASAAGLKELGSWQYSSPIPMEAVLKTSFPAPGDMERVRAILDADADSGEDRLGIGLSRKDGQILASYPMTMFVWQRS